MYIIYFRHTSYLLLDIGKEDDIVIAVFRSAFGFGVLSDDLNRSKNFISLSVFLKRALEFLHTSSIILHSFRQQSYS